MKSRVRALAAAVLGIVALSVVQSSAAGATGGCWPRIDRQTYEISVVC